MRMSVLYFTYINTNTFLGQNMYQPYLKCKHSPVKGKVSCAIKHMACTGKAKRRHKSIGHDILNTESSQGTIIVLTHPDQLDPFLGNKIRYPLVLRTNQARNSVHQSKHSILSESLSKIENNFHIFVKLNEAYFFCYLILHLSFFKCKSYKGRTMVEQWKTFKCKKILHS